MINSIDGAVSFLAQYHRPLGIKPEMDLGDSVSDLPGALSLIYRKLGGLIEISPSNANDYRPPFAAQDALIPLSRLERTGAYIDFACENQGNWTARCAIGQADPPVLTNAGDGSGSDEFDVVCNSVAAFLTTLCLQEAVMSSPVVFNLGGEDLREVLVASPNALWLNGPYAVRNDGRDFYTIGVESTLIMVWGGIWIGSYSESAVKVLKPEFQNARLL